MADATEDRGGSSPCRCHAHGIGHAPATEVLPFTRDGVPRLCRDCLEDGCDADRPLPMGSGDAHDSFGWQR
jgi:hypothetical protein